LKNKKKAKIGRMNDLPPCKKRGGMKNPCQFQLVQKLFQITEKIKKPRKANCPMEKKFLMGSLRAMDALSAHTAISHKGSSILARQEETFRQRQSDYRSQILLSSAGEKNEKQASPDEEPTKGQRKGGRNLAHKGIACPRIGRPGPMVSR